MTAQQRRKGNFQDSQNSRMSHHHHHHHHHHQVQGKVILACSIFAGLGHTTSHPNQTKLNAKN